MVTKEGLLLRRGQPQKVLLRVAQEFLPQSEQCCTGLWSSKAMQFTVEPYVNLLLSAPPLQLLGKRFNPSTTQGYMSLYGAGFSEVAISAALRCASLSISSCLLLAAMPCLSSLSKSLKKSLVRSGSFS